MCWHMKSLPENHRDAETGKKLLALINANYAIHWADHTRPYPGIPELLDALTARAVKITVLSNKADDLTNICVTKLLSRWHFALVAGSRPNIPNKPDPAGALQLAKQAGLSPAEFLYLGDSDIDMKTAVGAGMYTHRRRLGVPFRTGTARRGGQGCNQTAGRTAGVFVKELSAVSVQP